jgi:hypothetical protein
MLNNRAAISLKNTLALTYYLLLQDRIKDAEMIYSRVKKNFP